MAGEGHVADLDPFGLLDTESDRVASFFAAIDEAGWSRPTRCEGWRVRELLSHLAGVETYHLACLDDSIAELFEDASKAGVTDVHSFNAWAVQIRGERPRKEVIDEWRTKNGEVRRRMRDLGRDGSMSSSVGPYPAGLMAFHVASEYATHADDMAIEIAPAERASRTAWRKKVSRFAIEETEKPVEIEERDGEVVVRLDEKEALLNDDELVEAVTARLPDDHPIDAELREKLISLA